MGDPDMSEYMPAGDRDKLFDFLPPWLSAEQGHESVRQGLTGRNVCALKKY